MPPRAADSEDSVLRLVEAHLERVEGGFDRLSSELRELRVGVQASWNQAIDKVLSAQERGMNRLTVVIALALVAVLASSGANLYVSYQGASIGTGQAALAGHPSPVSSPSTSVPAP